MARARESGAKDDKPTAAVVRDGGARLNVVRRASAGDARRCSVRAAIFALLRRQRRRRRVLSMQQEGARAIGTHKKILLVSVKIRVFARRRLAFFCAFRFAFARARFLFYLVNCVQQFAEQKLRLMSFPKLFLAKRAAFSCFCFLALAFESARGDETANRSDDRGDDSRHCTCSA